MRGLVLRVMISLEAEGRSILRNAMIAEDKPSEAGLGSRIAARFARSGLAEPLPELRGQVLRPAHLLR
jgi:plasmid stability protein